MIGSEHKQIIACQYPLRKQGASEIVYACARVKREVRSAEGMQEVVRKQDRVTKPTQGFTTLLN